MRELPEGEGWAYEPKWDGFRGVLENLDGELALWSRNERPLLRYFPELRPLGDALPPRSALDGEVVIVREGALDFDAMQMRLHPAESRIRRLSAEIPAEFVAFDVLVWEGEPVWQKPLAERRAALEQIEGFRLSPQTRELAEARSWLDRFESLGLDGVVAKRLAVPYLPGSRDGVVKVKEHKTRRLRGRRHPLEGRARPDRNAAARPLPRRRRDRLRRLCGRRGEDARGGCREGAAARRGRPGLARRRAEPLGHRRARAGARSGPSSWSRCATTRCRATASATARS